MNETQHLIEYFKQSPFIIQLAWIISGVFFVSIVPLIFYLKYLRGHLRENEKIVAKYQNEYEQYLVTYLYTGNEEEEISSDQQLIINKLKKCIVEPFKRKIVISTLLKLKNEISGEMAESIQKLYFQTGLIDYTLPKLRSKKWYSLAKGIRELRQFQVKEAHDEVIIYINHPKREVRKEMQLYMVNLFYFEGLDFLNVLETPLSEWDQIQLLEVLQRFDNQKIPDIKPWLKSSNDSVVVFALKLAKIYNQFEAKDELINMLEHKNKDIRIDVIFVLSHLIVLEAKEVLKNNFDMRSQEEQIAFFKMMENLYENSDEPFLLEHIHNENFEIKLSALKILKVINSDKFNNIKLESLEPEFLRIVNFIENN
ncbi:HEAT repeat domain-containing protein [Flavobacterium sp. XS2P12]|uniref:HEAT repeat domain-containing protein n=1 Tax=Flavobacterium melibiosi TaxID=3398734 RepID=UPI003A8B6C8E